MNLLEVGLFLGVVFVLYLLLSPLRRLIESNLYPYFRKRFQGKDGVIIDVTDSLKKKEKSNDQV